MANVPEGLYYSKDHEWLRVEGDTGTVGITDHAQNSLGDVVYVELPKAGDTFAGHESFGSVESVKAVSELFLPVGGEVVQINEALQDEPERVNNDPCGRPRRAPRSSCSNAARGWPREPPPPAGPASSARAPIRTTRRRS